MKRIGVWLAGALAVLVSSSVLAAVSDRIVAVVNDDVITLSELNRAFEPYQTRFSFMMGAERAKTEADAKRELLNRRIDELLIEQQTKKAGITVTTAEVEAMLKDIMTSRNLTLEELRRALEKEGGTLEMYKRQMQEQIVRMKLVRVTIKDKGTVSDEEIGEYYAKHREDYEGNVSVRVRQIFLPLPKENDPTLKEKAQADMEAIHQRLLKGEAFEALSALYSQGPAAETGGDIGFIEKGMILAEIEEVALRLAVNQISEVIESSVGFHIIQVTDRRGAGLKPIEAVRNEIRERLEQEKLERKFVEWLGDLRQKSHIEIKL